MGIFLSCLLWMMSSLERIFPILLTVSYLFLSLETLCVCAKLQSCF